MNGLTLEQVLLVAVLAVLLVVLGVLLLRRPAADPSIEQIRAGQERQAERLGSLAGELSAAVARSGEALGQTISGFSIEQTRALAQAIAEQRSRLDTIERALLERLGTETAALQARLTEEQAKSRDAAEVRLGEMLKALIEGLSAQRERLDASDKALMERLRADAERTQLRLTEEAERSRNLLDAKLREMRESNDARLGEIQKSVNEQLTAAVEKQMAESFTRVIDQFQAIQAMMGNVQSVASQVGDLRRLFANVKTRGGWGEAQVKALLDDILPPGSYETNRRLREDSDDVVEFAIRMPVSGEEPVFLPVDAKFPVEDYERLLAAHDAGDAEAEASARKALEVRIRLEAQKIRQKYINPPRTTEFAVMYVPTEGLYAEIARAPGLIDDIGRSARVFVAGPSLLPAMLRTIQLGHVTLALSRNAESVRELLAATKTEMGKMDGVLEKLGKNIGTVSNTIEDARRRARVIGRRLKGVEALPEDQSALLLGTGDPRSEPVEDEEP